MAQNAPAPEETTEILDKQAFFAAISTLARAEPGAARADALKTLFKKIDRLTDGEDGFKKKTDILVSMTEFDRDLGPVGLNRFDVRAE